MAVPSLTDLRNRRGEILELARVRGASRVRVFGSIVRGDATDASDIDMLVEFEHETPEFRQHMGLLLFLEELLGRTVDLATPRMIRPELEPYVMADLLYVA